MKKTQRKDAVRNIRRKIVSWISIVIVTMITVGVFLGCICYNFSLREQALDYFQAHNFKDLEVISSNGILSSEIDQLRQVEGIKDVEGYQLLTVSAEYNGSVWNGDLLRKMEHISVQELVDGAFPEEKDELAVSRIMAEERGIKLGDSIKLTPPSELENVIRNKEFIVTGIVDSPDYYLVRSSDFFVAADGAFNLEQLNGDGYLRAAICCELPEGTDIFSDDYFTAIETVENRIRLLFPDMKVSHEQRVRELLEEQLEEKIAEPKKKLEDGRAELEKGQKKLEDAKKKLDDGEKEKDEKEKELAEGKLKLEEAEKEIADGEKKLEDGRRELEEKEEAARKELADNKAKLREAEKTVNAAAAKVKETENKLKEIALALGKSDLPAEYYTLKKNAISYYLPAMRARMQNKPYESLVSQAQKKVDADVDAGVDSLVKLLEQASAEKKEFNDELLKQVSGDVKTFLRKAFNGLGEAGAAETALNEAKRTLAAEEKKGEAELAKAKDELAAGEKKLNDAKAQYEDGKAQYEDGLVKLEEGKKKLADGKKEYEDGLAEFEENKKKLEDGEAELEQQIAEGREKIDQVAESSFVVQNRRTNTGFITLKTTVHTLLMASMAFIILFLIVCSLVAFSTVMIIIDEQKNLVGAMKSLGFFNGAIRAKYLVFGLTATAAGSIIGILLFVGIEDLFRFGIETMFISGVPDFVFKIYPLLLAMVLLFAAISISVFVACRGVLKHSAVDLISGNTTAKSIKRETKTKKKGGLYRRLIFRNMRTEIVRVAITTFIIGASCALIGIGFTMKTAFAGMVDLQISDVWGYDVRVSFDQKLSQEKRDQMEKILRDAGADFAPGMEQGVIYRSTALQEYTYLFVIDQDSIPSYYHVRDQKTGEEMTLPEDGVLIQNRMQETQDLQVGDRLVLCDQKLREHSTTIAGVYINYYGRTTIISRTAYEKLFGEAAKNNLYLIHLNGADKEALLQKLREVVPELVTDSGEKLNQDFAGLKGSYDTIVLLLTAMAIMMSIFILTNLTNIFISRRRKELIVMRVNGFSQRQCIGYLVRETLTTSILGFVLAIIMGSAIGLFMVRLLEEPTSMLDRSIQPMAWVIAVLMEGVFAFCIDAWVFRKVKDLKVTEINA